jgi:hypothetical protein
VEGYIRATHIYATTTTGTVALTINDSPPARRGGSHDCSLAINLVSVIISIELVWKSF